MKVLHPSQTVLYAQQFLGNFSISIFIQWRLDLKPNVARLSKYANGLR